MPRKAVDSQTLIEDFIWEKTVFGRTSQTIRYYQSELHLFLRWAQRQTPKINPLTATDRDILCYIVHLRKTRSDGGVDASFRALRTWYNWLHQKKHTKRSSPCKDIKLSKEKKIRPVYSKDDIMLILKSCQHSRLFPIRDRLIVLLLLEQGLRAKEVIDLTLESFQDNHIIIDGKGRKQRVLPLSPLVKKTLKQYTDRERPEQSPHKQLILSDERKPLKYWGLRLLLIRLGERVGLAGVQAHKFRRTFATVLAPNVPNATWIQYYLGHESVQTSMIYVNQAEVLAHAKAFSILGLMEGK